MASIDAQTGRIGAEGIVERAIELRPLLIEQAPETEAPRRYGGLELDITTWLRLILEVAHGDIQAGWCLTLAAGHALQVASYYEQQAQDEIFGDGDFRAAAVAAPMGNARKVDGGWRVTGAWPYSSGAPYSTHYFGQTLIKADDAPPRMMLFVAERSQWEMLEDWGDLLGLKGSGSHTVRLEDGFVPDGWALPDKQLVEVDVSGGTPGSRLHGNPMYAGRCFSIFQLELSALMIGAAKGALDEYEQIVTTRRTQRPPTTLRSEDPDYQRWFGTAIGRLATAQAAVMNAGDQWTELCRRNVEEDAGFARADDQVLNFIGRDAMRMAWDAMQEHIVRTAGSSALRDGERLQRIYRDMTMGHGHFASLFGDSVARQIGQHRLGAPLKG
jgi:3-hydroxy-9,10-secoandrosta-1,3,5(10)-triene-9,17-dione monooxygenase